MPLNKETKPNSSHATVFTYRQILGGKNELLIPPAMNEIVPLLFFYKGDFGIK